MRDIGLKWLGQVPLLEPRRTQVLTLLRILSLQLLWWLRHHCWLERLWEHWPLIQLELQLLHPLDKLGHPLLGPLLQFVHYLLVLVLEGHQLLVPLLNVDVVLLQLQLKCLNLLRLSLDCLTKFLVLLRQL